MDPMIKKELRRLLSLSAKADNINKAVNTLVFSGSLGREALKPAEKHASNLRQKVRDNPIYIAASEVVELREHNTF